MADLQGEIRIRKKVIQKVKKTISFLLAFVLIFCAAAPAMATDYYSSHFKFSTSFVPKTTVGMQQLENYTMADWLEDDDNRALLAVCLFGDVIIAERKWNDYFKLGNIPTGGYLAKTGSTEIAYCVWTLDRTMCVTYNPFTGTGTYAMYPMTRDEITESFGNAKVWTINEVSFNAAVSYVGMIMNAVMAKG